VPVAGLLESVASQFESVARERSISLVVEAAAEIAVLAHRQLIEQAVANLVSNAVRYSCAGGTVILRAEAVAGSVIISVEDEGPGIPAEHLPRLFERFYRVDKGRSRELGGTGLGLAIVKHIALVHGGRAEVESEPERGSTFRIILPAG
jgi:two-component system phosphate regulon sensor histidine kinase PhoR